MKIIKETIYYVKDDSDGDNYWNEWRTNKKGTWWENRMGCSWEEMEPPKRLKQVFLTAIKDNWE